MLSAVRPASVLLLAVLVAAPAAALAEKADRSKPMEVEADKSGHADFVNQVLRFSGNVVITQGTMVIRADRVELRETPDGYRVGTAWGTAGAPVRYRQKRDGVDEYVEGAADRVEFDGRNETLRLIGNAMVRRLRDSVAADEITGAVITWNHGAELFSAQGAASAPDAAGGRVRAVLSPRAAASAASAPSGQPGTAPARGTR